MVYCSCETILEVVAVLVSWKIVSNMCSQKSYPNFVIISHCLPYMRAFLSGCGNNESLCTIVTHLDVLRHCCAHIIARHTYIYFSCPWYSFWIVQVTSSCSLIMKQGPSLKSTQVLCNSLVYRSLSSVRLCIYQILFHLYVPMYVFYAF